MSSLNDARIIRTRAALQNSLLALIERRPLEEITIREIAAESGVHYATFFRHHGTKEELLNAIAAEEIQCLVDMTLPVVFSRDRHAVHLALLQYVDKHRKLWTTLLTGGAAAAMKQEMLRLCKTPAEDRVPGDSGIPVELVVISAVSVILESLAWWLAQSSEAMSIERLATILDRIAFTTVPVHRPKKCRR